MATWVIDAFFIPLIYLHQYRIETFLEDLTLRNVSGFLNGWDAIGSVLKEPRSAEAHSSFASG